MLIVGDRGNNIFLLDNRWDRHEPSAVLFIANLIKIGMKVLYNLGKEPACLIREINNDQMLSKGVDNVNYILDFFASTSPATPFQSISFKNHPSVPLILRGRKIETLGETEGYPGLDGSFGDILATCEWGPLWCTKAENEKRHDTIVIKLPKINDNDGFLDHFTSNRFPAWVPLMEFLRGVLGETSWSPPKIRACFVFDDPNLHWPEYGFVDYRRLAHEAEINNYHVSFATIPLDSWMVSSSTAEIFRRNKDRLSLLIHGNNHTYNELIFRNDYNNGLPLLAQALRRIERLERVTGVPVSRIMAAPHGACNESAMRDMVKLGILGACISFGSLIKYNCGCNWLHNLGIKPAELISGLPVLNRFNIGRNWKNEIIRSAFLGQAIIPCGHHLDLSDGVDILQERSEFINSFGDVEWTNMEKIADLNYSTKKNGSNLFLRSYTRRVKIRIPDGVQTLKLEIPPSDDPKDNLVCTITGNDALKYPVCSNDIAIPVTPGMEVELRRIHSESISHHNIKAPPFRPWTIVRRMLTETRDRLQSIINFLQ